MRTRLVLVLTAVATVSFRVLPSSAPAQTVTPKPATPAPAATPKKVDRADPKAVVQAFGAAIATGDRATARSLTFGTARQLEYVEAMIDDYQAIIRFDKALKSKFGRDANDYLDYYERYHEFSKKAEIELDGDEATATFEVLDKDEEIWDLVKRNGQWGLDADQFWDPEEEPESSPEQLRKSTKAIDDITLKMTAGAYAKVDDAIDAFDETQDLSQFKKD